MRLLVRRGHFRLADSLSLPYIRADRTCRADTALRLCSCRESRMGKELVLAFGARSHGRNLVPVLHDDNEAALCHDSIRCGQSPIPMRFCAGVASSEFASLPRSSATGGTTDGEYLFCTEIVFRHREMFPQTCAQGCPILYSFWEKCGARRNALPETPFSGSLLAVWFNTSEFPEEIGPG